MKVSVKFMTPTAHCSCGVGFGLLARLHAVVDPDRRAALQLDLAAGDDFDTLVESLEDRDLITTGRPGRYEGLPHHQRVGRQLRSFVRLGLLVGSLRRRLLLCRLGILGGLRGACALSASAFCLDDEYGLAVRVIDDRGLWQRQITLLRAYVDADVGEHARRQARPGFGTLASSGTFARVAVDLRADCTERAFERLWKCIERQRDFLAGLELGKRLLRQMEIHVDRVELLHGHNLRARAQISTGIDGDNAGPAGEGCAQLLLRHIDLLLCHRRLLGLQVGGRLVVIGFADHLHRQLFLGATIRDLGQRGGGFELTQLGDVFAVAQLQQHLAFLHLLA